MGCWSESCRSHTWNSSALPTLKQLHDNLLTHYNCKEWAPPLADDAPAPDDYRYHIKKGLVLGKSLKIVRYQTFINRHNQA
jgi:hypothetical protein